MQQTARLALAMALLPILVGAAQAVSDCSLKMSPKTGALEVSASGMGASPRWGVTADGVIVPFADEATCFTSKALHTCHLGAPGTLAERTPPEGCIVYVNDDRGPPCEARLEGCLPGARPRDASFVDPNDRRGRPKPTPAPCRR